MSTNYFTSETHTLLRSQIHPSSYNPRVISEEGRKALKRSIKLYGVVGGIVVNKQTGYTIVGGHQKVNILDEINHFPEKDYELKVEVIDVDEKREKELNITLNNPNVSGDWDADKLASLIPEIDYKAAGLTDQDLNVIGCDFLLKTEDENLLSEELDNVMAPVQAEKAEEKAIKAAEREAKVAHMKEVKEQVKQSAQSKVDDMDSYVMITFDNINAKAEFMNRFGYPEETRVIRGREFGDKIERVE